jgi:hypothetical protein
MLKRGGEARSVAVWGVQHGACDFATLTRASTRPGTYARISVYPVADLDLDIKAPKTHEIVNRAFIEIVRI